MNLGKLLGAGKSFFGGGGKVAYRTDKSFYLPKFNAEKKSVRAEAGRACAGRRARSKKSFRRAFGEDAKDSGIRRTATESADADARDELDGKIKSVPRAAADAACAAKRHTGRTFARSRKSGSQRFGGRGHRSCSCKIAHGGDAGTGDVAAGALVLGIFRRTARETILNNAECQNSFTNQ